MESKLLLHPKTKAQVKSFLSQPFHFLMIYGQSGAGKNTLAKFIASQLLKTELREGINFFTISKPEDKTEIPLENVRKIIKQLSLKPAKSTSIARVVFIENGQFLNNETQNSLLKTLEEPPTATIFIVSVDSPTSLVQTILSRSQQIEANPVNLELAKEFFGGDQKAVSSAWALSEGNVGLLSSLLSSESSDEPKAAVEQAKNFLRLSKYERLADPQMQRLSRDNLINFLDGLKRVVKALQRSAILNHKSPRRLLEARRLIDELTEAAQANVTPRLIYLRLVQKLKL